jgi:NAD(P)-dependent dehydrogenase (short-subunit alcohol dehydrogenase family)
MLRKPKNRKPDQALTTESLKTAADRPAGGVVHPAHGTIGAPIVVVGATGTIGRLVVAGLVTAGHHVIAVAPDRSRLEDLRLEHPDGAVTTWAGRVLTDNDATQLASRLRTLGRPIGGAVVAIAIRTGRGRLLDQSADELAGCLDQILLPQLAIARHLVPLLAESGRNGSYVMVGRPGIEASWAGYGHLSIAMAGVRMVAHALHEEARPLGVRVHLLSIDSPIRGDAPGTHECPEWPTVSGIARRVVQLIERAPASEPAQAVVTCSRRSQAASVAASTEASPQRSFLDVPAFLKSLKTKNT